MPMQGFGSMVHGAGHGHHRPCVVVGDRQSKLLFTKELLGQLSNYYFSGPF